MAEDRKSVLTEEQEAALVSRFDGLVKLAQADAPQLSNYKGDVEKFKKENTEYFGNPLLKVVKEIQRDVEEQSKGASPEDKATLYEMRIQEVRNTFANSIKKGQTDEDEKNSQRGKFERVFGALMSGDFMGAIMAMLGDTISDWMGAGKDALFSGGEKSFTDAKEERKLTKALDAAAINLGLSETAGDMLVAQGLEAASPAKKKEVPNKENEPAVTGAQPPKKEEKEEKKTASIGTLSERVVGDVLKEREALSDFNLSNGMVAVTEARAQSVGVPQTENTTSRTA